LVAPEQHPTLAGARNSSTTYFLVRLLLHPAFINEPRERKSQATGQVAGQIIGQVHQFREQPRKASEIQALGGVEHRKTFRENCLTKVMGPVTRYLRKREHQKL
jgi:hypothetical protein